MNCLLFIFAILAFAAHADGFLRSSSASAKRSPLFSTIQPERYRKNIFDELIFNIVSVLPQVLAPAKAMDRSRIVQVINRKIYCNFNCSTYPAITRRDKSLLLSVSYRHQRMLFFECLRDEEVVGTAFPAFCLNYY